MWKTMPVLLRLIEVHAVPGDHVEQVVHREGPKIIGLQVVRGDECFSTPSAVRYRPDSAS